MSVFTALFWRALFFLVKFWLWMAYFIVTSTLLMIVIAPQMGVPENVTASEHERQDFPKRSREQVLMALEYVTQLMVFPKNEHSSKLMSLVQKHHSKLTVDFWNKRSDIVDIGGEGVLRLVFHEISPNKLDYTVFIRKDMGIFPVLETPGPATSDEDLMSAGHPAIQVAVDEAYMEMFGIPRQQWNIRKNPYPKYSSIDPNVGYRVGPTKIWYMILIGILGIITRYGQQLVEEKSSGIGELLAIYGISNFQSQISWFFTISVVHLTMTTLQTLVMVFPVLGHVIFLKSSAWVVLLVLLSYYQTSLVFATFLSTFCTNSTNWSIAVLAFFLGSGVLIRLLNIGHQSNFVLRMACLLPVGGLHQCISAMIEFEKVNQGVQMNNFFSQPPVNYNLSSVGESIICMIAGSLLALVLLIYCNMIWPRKYGTPKPWYFPCPFLPKYLKSPCSMRESSVNPLIPTSAVREEVKIETPVAVEVQQIHKSFGRVKALKGVSLNIYANQITALLGENGAGKTTLLGIITGMLTPTEGTILVSGQDISEGDHLKKFRRNIGYCPQNDLLMDYLTVQQHLIFFLLLQGADYQKANVQSIHWMDQFNLSERKDVAVAKLSGGMKRKLTLCISLARDPTILILDEPTSGLDPVARREVWNILYKTKGKRTIILTTHRMEEADALSDYIVILSDGNLRVFGSNEFLKSRYGGEYQVSFVPLTEGLKMSEEFLDTIQKRFDSTSVINKSDNNLVLGVKSNDAQEVLRFVERNYGNRVGITVTSGTIDDVFVHVRQKDGVRISVDETAMPSRNDPTLQNRKSHMLVILMLVISKRFLWARHNWKTLLIYIVIWPVASSLLAMVLPGILNPIAIKEGGVTAELRSYGETTSLISENERTKELSNIIKSSISLQDGTYQVIDADRNIDDALIDKAAKHLKLYRSKMIFSADLRGNLTVYYSSVATLAVPIAINMITNAMIHANRSQRPVKTQIFLQPALDLELDHPRDALLLKFMMVFLFCTGIQDSFSYFVMFPHEERTTLMKHLQLMTGLHWSIYWMANVLADFVIVLSTVIITMIFFVFWDSTIAVEPFFTQRPYFDVTIIILILFGWSSISFAYLCSYFFRKVTWCITAYQATQLFLFILYFIFLQLFSVFKKSGFLVTKLKYVFYLVPLIPFFVSLGDTLSSHKVFYIDHSTRGMFDYDETFSDLIADISLELIYFVVDFALYLSLVIIIDGKSWRRIKNRMCSSRVFYDSSKADADVLQERDRIQTLNKDNEPFLVVDNLSKSYRKCTAANGVSFTVERGDFFGLLGLNGAGKTTTFKILTGLENSNRGDARIEGKSLVKARRSYLKSLGFCPQSEGLLEPLSGKKLLELFGALRGLDGEDLKTTVEKWTDILDMDKIKDRRCGEYSGGNKRKLSVAMSLIGDPSVVFLDEPTTGVDPVSRRKLWSLLKRSQNLGSTFIFTSHSLDECEALCDRVTIMAGGYMKCLGPISRLKLTYSAGFKIIVRMNTNSTENDITKVKKSVDGTFHSTYSLMEEEPFMLSFHITKKDMKWSERFDWINVLKSQVPQIHDIVISDSSLEQVFYNVTKP